jgi:hypothetical protein
MKNFLNKWSANKTLINISMVLSTLFAIGWVVWSLEAPAELWWLAGLAYIPIFFTFFFSLFFIIKGFKE